ncbi:hypothetical protein BGZ73_005902 [Actinomortierella ambigua]|nr:hypothetical protein BGZ73_005902 [Actinomortierella ambigua]
MELPSDFHKGAGVSRCHCSIIPPYILEAIIERNLAPREVIEIARKTLDQIATIRRSRVSTHRINVRGAATALAPSRGRLRRVIYDSEQTDELRKTLLFDDAHGGYPETLTDSSAKNVHRHFETIFKFYHTVFGRASYDGDGAVIHASVNYDGNGPFKPGYMNAHWILGPDPEHSDLAFGDGAPMIMADFTEFLDVAGHEFTHAVVDYTGILPYFFQAGALNESISDVFGSMVKQYSENQKVEDVRNWLVAERIWTIPDRAKRSLRDMENPGTAYNNTEGGKDPQPASMDGYIELPVNVDYGGVHYNSGIPNRAFVLAAKAIGGYAWEGAGKIWYEALTDPALSNHFVENGRTIEYFDYDSVKEIFIQRASKAQLDSLHNTFKIFADLTINHARAHSQKAVNAVESAWRAIISGSPELQEYAKKIVDEAYIAQKLKLPFNMTPGSFFRTW